MILALLAVSTVLAIVALYAALPIKWGESVDIDPQNQTEELAILPQTETNEIQEDPQESEQPVQEDQEEEEEQEPTEIPNSATFEGKLAFVRNGNVWVLADGVEKKLTFLKPKKSFVTQTKLSPDGSKVAFIRRMHDENKQQIVVVDLSTLREDVMVDHFWGYGIDWMPDSQNIVFKDRLSNNFDDVTMVIKSVNISNKSIKQYGSYDPEPVGCGGSYPDPLEYLSQLTVAYPHVSATNAYVVFNAVCDGSRATIQNLANNQNIVINEKAVNSVISPTGDRIATQLGNSILIVNTLGSVISTFPLTATPQEMIWNQAGDALFFTSEVFLETLNFESGNLLPEPFYKVSLKATELWKLDLKLGQVQKLGQIDAYNLSLVYADNEKVYAAMLENDRDLIAYVRRNLVNKDYKASFWDKIDRSIKFVEIGLTTLRPEVIVRDVKFVNYLAK